MKHARGMHRVGSALLPVGIVAGFFLGCATRQQYDNLESGMEELREENHEIGRDIEALREMVLAEHDLILNTKADVLAEVSGLREQLFLMENRLGEPRGEMFPGAATPAGETGRAGSDGEPGERVEEGTIASSDVRDATNPPSGERAEIDAGLEDRVTYDSAFLDMTRGKYELAIEGFQTFIGRPGESQLRDNAQYWIGECWYALGDRRRAIEEFQRVVDDYPRGNKIPSALFKIGKCYFELGDSDAAGRFFRSVVNGYPRSEEANLARDYLTEL